MDTGTLISSFDELDMTIDQMTGDIRRTTREHSEAAALAGAVVAAREVPADGLAVLLVAALRRIAAE